MNTPRVRGDDQPAHSPTRFDVVIVGAGFSGLLCASYLKDAGIDDVCVRNNRVRWRRVEHRRRRRLPRGHLRCAVRPVPAVSRPHALYSSKKYISQSEISGYAELLTDHIGVRDRSRYSRQVVELKHLGRGDA